MSAASSAPRSTCLFSASSTELSGRRHVQRKLTKRLEMPRTRRRSRSMAGDHALGERFPPAFRIATVMYGAPSERLSSSSCRPNLTCAKPQPRAGVKPRAVW